MRIFIQKLLLLTAVGSVAGFSVDARAQQPLYIVNGVPTTDNIAQIPPEDIERIETLPADEESIARYGEQASNGVVLVTLRYDEPAR
ncbi:MAG: TonB-dependent receptor plug domain-containing protein, partial [Alistipes sp.]|nr:TonB-dependent receptor plug domain-containing protein [Alistipes sp.]